MCSLECSRIHNQAPKSWVHVFLESLSLWLKFTSSVNSIASLVRTIPFKDYGEWERKKLKCKVGWNGYLDQTMSRLGITKFRLSFVKVSKGYTCPALSFACPAQATLNEFQNSSLFFGKLSKFFACPPLFLPVMDRWTVCYFLPVDYVREVARKIVEQGKSMSHWINDT